jgi:Protein of unknown function (DUF2630)
MTAFPGWEHPRTAEDINPPLPEKELYARIEGLIGQEIALLDIPARERTDAEHARLHEIGVELDRIFERLRERAENLRRRGAEESP